VRRPFTKSNSLSLEAKLTRQEKLSYYQFEVLLVIMKLIAIDLFVQAGGSIDHMQELRKKTMIL
jgi:hypothetical protein